MTTNNINISVTDTYKHKSKQECDDFMNTIKAKMKLTNDKLDTVMLKGELHPSVARRVTQQCHSEDVKAADDINARKKEFLDDLDEKVYSILYVNISDPTLKGRLADDFDGKGHEAYKHIMKKWAVGGTSMSTRVNIAMTTRKEHLEENITGIALKTIEPFVEKYAKLNKELKDTVHFHNDEMFTTTILDSMAFHSLDLVRNFKTANAAILTTHAFNHGTKWADVWDKLQEVLEENDRIENLNAVRTQREALRVQTESQASELKVMR